MTKYVTRYRSQLIWIAALALVILVLVYFVRVASAAVSYVSNTTDTATGSTVTLLKPAGVVDGDIVVIAVSMRRDTATVNCPAGDTEIANSANFVTPSGFTSIRSQSADTYTQTFYRFAQASDTSYAVNIQGNCNKSACNCLGTTSASAKYTATAVAYRGVDSVTTVEASASGTGTGSTITAPSVTTTGENSMVLGVFSVVGAQTLSSASYAQRVHLQSSGGSAASKGTLMLGDYTQAIAGATGAKTATSTGTSVNVGMQVALKAKIYPSFTQAAYRWFNNTDATGTMSFLKTYDPGTVTKPHNDIIQTSDGGYATTGAGAKLAKYTLDGKMLWAKWGIGEGASVTETSDGGFAITGQTTSYGGGSWDIFVTKYDSAGNMIWNQTWGDTGAEYGKSIIQTSDGGLAVVGYGDDGTSHNGFLLKYTSTGTLSWQRSWGGTSAMDRAYGVTETSDTGLVITGLTNSYTAGAYDLYIAKYTSAGTLSWTQTLGGASADDYGNEVIQANDGGLLVVGQTSSYGAGSGDALLAKYTSTGTLTWIKTWGGSGDDEAYTLTQTSDGRIGIGGSTSSYGAGAYDSFMAEFTSAGVLSWSRTYGTTGNEYGYSVTKTTDGGYALAGSDGAGFVAKYPTNGTITNCSTSSGGGPNPPPPPCSSPNASSSSISPVTSTPSAASTTQNRSTSAPALSSTSYTSVTTTEIAASTTLTMNVGSALANVNTSAVSPSQGTPFRLRFVMHVGTINVAAGDESFRLQVAQRGVDGVCDASFSAESYADVTPNSGAIRFYHNQNAGDEIGFTANANDPSDSNHTKVLQTYEESNPLPVTNAIQVGQDGMWDVALVNNSATGGASYCFRIVKNDGSLLDTYSVVPEISIPTAATVEQSSYRLYQNADSLVPGTPLAAQNTAASVTAGTTFRLRQLITQTTGSSGIGGAAYKLQIGQKSTTCSSASFADVTLFQNNASPADDTAISTNVNDPTPASGTVVAQTYNENAAIGVTATVATGNSGLWDFSLSSDQSFAGKTYCFRIVDSGGGVLATYTNYAEVAFTSASPTLTQQLRGGQAVVNGVKSAFTW